MPATPATPAAGPLLVTDPDSAGGTGLILGWASEVTPRPVAGPGWPMWSCRGAALDEIGLAIPAQRPLTAAVMLIQA